MTQAEVLDLLEFLQGCYPKAEFSDGNVRAYMLMLRDLDFQAAKLAVTKLAATSKWLPTIAEIREAALASSGDDVPSVDDAYEQAREYVRHGYNPNPVTPGYEAVGAPVSRREKSLHPLVRRAMEIVGVDTMALTDEPMIAAAQFRQVYQRLAAAERERKQLPPAALPTPRKNGHLAAAKAKMLQAWRVDQREEDQP